MRNIDTFGFPPEGALFSASTVSRFGITSRGWGEREGERERAYTVTTTVNDDFTEISHDNDPSDCFIKLRAWREGAGRTATDNGHKLEPL